MVHEDAQVNRAVPPLNHATDQRFFLRAAGERRADRAAGFGFGLEEADDLAAFFASASANAACAAASRAIGTR